MSSFARFLPWNCVLLCRSKSDKILVVLVKLAWRRSNQTQIDRREQHKRSTGIINARSGAHCVSLNSLFVCRFNYRLRGQVEVISKLQLKNA